MVVEETLKRVTIIQRGISKHRIPFFEKLKDNLNQHKIQLQVVHGHFSRRDASKSDLATLSWAKVIRNRTLKIGPSELYWQPALRYLHKSDLIIMEQANKLLLNYLLIFMQCACSYKTAFWGHGKNFQQDGGSRASKSIKCFMSRRVNWWFAYNDLSASIVKSYGYPKKRITSVQNAIDTCRLIEAQRSISRSDLELIKKTTGIKGNNVCIYIGGMYEAKRLDFLLESCIQIRNQVSDFEIIFIGDGPDEAKVKRAAEKYDWIYYVGPKHDVEKIPYFMLSKLFLIPGLVGLAILDAFALETPLITTNLPYHSPEIDYLVDGINGVIVKNAHEPRIYANEVAYYLKNEDARKKLAEGCRVARDKYTIEEMVERFSKGIIQALAA